jgi:hypothetical protein
MIFNPENHNFKKIKELHANGYELLCPKCKATLVIALTLYEAKEKGVHPGMYCPTNPQHVHMTVSLASTRQSLWEKLENL